MPAEVRSFRPPVVRLLVHVVEWLDGLPPGGDEPDMLDWQDRMLWHSALDGRGQRWFRGMADRAEAALSAASVDDGVQPLADALLARALSDVARAAAREDVRVARAIVGDFDRSCTMAEFADHVRAVIAERGW